jgi:glycosyltransferase involved in cell wall biosynthesis
VAPFARGETSHRHYTPAVRIDQILPSLASRDAIGVHTLALTDALRAAGVDSDIYYGNSTPDVATLGRPVSELGRQGRDRWLLYHASIGSPVFNIVAARGEPKLVNYHNITPAELLGGWAPQVSYEVALGRAQLERLAPDSRFAVADSAFNESELIDAGFTGTAVVPLLIDMTTTGQAPDPVIARRLARAKEGGGIDLVYVGKISPHKAPHDLVKMLAVYRRLYDPLARLHLIGSPLGEHYGPALQAFIDRLDLAQAVDMVGSLEPAGLEAYFAAADVYVSASEHEGFCVPVVEAMGRGIPVVAYGVTAVPETVGDAGIVLDSKEPLLLAAAVARVRSDPELRRILKEAAARRVAHFDLGRSKARFVELLTNAVSG